MLFRSAAENLHRDQHPSSRNAIPTQTSSNSTPMTDTDLLNALRDCYEPQTRRNLVDLNLVRSATLAPDFAAPGVGVPGVPQRYLAQVTLVARGSDDDANAQMRAQVENRLAGLPRISRVDVRILPPLLPILNSR